MPYESTFVARKAVPDHTGAVSVGSNDIPIYQLTLWRHQSLPRTGFVWFIAFTAVLLAFPLFAVLGSPVMWGLMPFVLLALVAIWWALERSYRDSEVSETLSIWQDHMSLVHYGPRKARAEWSANPYWVRTALHATAGPVPNYLTLRGGDREVELGSFLSEPERIALRDDVDAALRNVRWIEPLANLNAATQCNTTPITYPTSNRHEKTVR